LPLFLWTPWTPWIMRSVVRGGADTMLFVGRGCLPFVGSPCHRQGLLRLQKDLRTRVEEARAAVAALHATGASDSTAPVGDSAPEVMLLGEMARAERNASM
jgi:hypothetical protein